MKLLSMAGIALCGAVVFTSVASAQKPVRRTPDLPSAEKVGGAIAIQAGGEAFQFTGQVRCTHEPRGYIYMVPAKLWGVSQSEGTRSVTLTFWRPASGSGDMFNLYVSSGAKNHHVDTVKTKDGGDPTGSGQVTFVPAGAGGTFTVNATTAQGVKITGTLRCDGFRAVMAEGGN